MTGGQDRAAVVRRLALAAACRSTRFRQLLASSSTPRLKTGALQRHRGSPRTPRELRVGGLIGNPVVVTADGTGHGATARLDDVLRRRPAVLTGGRPAPALVDLCRRHRLLLLRLIPGGAGAGGYAGAGGRPAETARDGWVELAVPDAEAYGLAALLADPALAVLVRPDRVVASLARGPSLPPLPWPARSVPASASTEAVV